MHRPLPDILATLARARTLADEAVRTAGDAAQRAPLLAAKLQELWPAPVAACLLREHPGPDAAAHACVLDATGQRKPKWDEALLPTLMDCAAPDADGKPCWADLPAAVRLPDHTLRGRPIAFQDRTYGALALALPRRLPDED